MDIGKSNNKKNINLVEYIKMIYIRVTFSASPVKLIKKLIKKSIGASVLHCHCYRQ